MNSPLSLDDAESFANTVNLPLTICGVTKELYGYAYVILDEVAALKVLGKKFGFDVDKIETGLMIMRERVKTLRLKEGCTE